MRLAVDVDADPVVSVRALVQVDDDVDGIFVVCRGDGELSEKKLESEKKRTGKECAKLLPGARDDEVAVDADYRPMAMCSCAVTCMMMCAPLCRGSDAWYEF